MQLFFINKHVVFCGFVSYRVDALPLFDKFAVLVKSVRIASLSSCNDTFFDSAAAVIAEFVIVQVFLNFLYVVFIEEVFGLYILHQVVVVETAVLVVFLQLLYDSHLYAESSNACAYSEISLLAADSLQ